MMTPKTLISRIEQMGARCYEEMVRLDKLRERIDNIEVACRDLGNSSGDEAASKIAALSYEVALIHDRFQEGAYTCDQAVDALSELT